MSGPPDDNRIVLVWSRANSVRGIYQLAYLRGGQWYTQHADAPIDAPDYLAFLPDLTRMMVTDA